MDDESSKEKEVFDKMKINYSESKQDIWAKLDERIELTGPKESVPKVIKMGLLKWSIAAAILVLVGLGVFAKFYEVNVSVSNGEFAEHKLPDGSTVHLNAATSISYHPYWWNFQREVNLSGEAFFEVKKGEKFSVISDYGTTEVLGTSFNIYARDKDYNVYCSTGKVKVGNSAGKSVILKPGNMATLNKNDLDISEASENEIISWRLNKFVYNTTSLDKVFKDLERQYDISISAKKQIRNNVYTGVFDRTISSEDALTIICLSFDLKFEETSSKAYRVY